MSSTDTANRHFALAASFVNHTNRSVFLTGRAGTGKTTFLKYIRENTFKKTAVVAPTGVAAINAGGVTIHSFFGLPLGAFIPVLHAGWNGNALNKHTLFKNIRLSAKKKELMQELELLIIDEVSMVRADLLDEVDTVLRQVRNRPGTAFGGLQVLFIGDLFQLPPVLTPEDRQLLEPCYKSPFFFDSQVLQEAPPVYIELQKIYRQNEASFISILNNIRNNQVHAGDLEQLHRRYRPGWEPQQGEAFITLTTHNARADSINSARLEQLPGKPLVFEAAVKGDFNPASCPADEVLLLKEGAQVMFIKNDKGEARRWYNGKLATVTKAEADRLFVLPEGEQEPIELEKETWRSIRYNYSREQDEVEEEELGSFTQYPIRLAWAITIHKSQGLTFEKAIVDAGASFAPGQVYVALSRLTSLDGMILCSRIDPKAISTDSRVLAFSAAGMQEAELEKELENGRRVFVSHWLLSSFGWSRLTEAVQEFHAGFEHRLIPDKTEAAGWAQTLLSRLTAQQEVAEKFSRQLEQLLAAAPQSGYATLQQRVSAAAAWFDGMLTESIAELEQQIRTYKIKQRVKKYIKELTEIGLLLRRKKLQLEQSVAIAEGLLNGTDTALLLAQVEQQKKIPASQPPAETAKPAKGETKRISLAMFNQGESIAAIAAARGLAQSTIEGHLAAFVATGEVPVEKLVTPEKMAVILRAIEENPGSANTALKELLGSSFSYGEVRAVQNHRQWIAEKDGNSN